VASITEAHFVIVTLHYVMETENRFLRMLQKYVESVSCLIRHKDIFVLNKLIIWLYYKKEHNKILRNSEFFGV
jgi:hypothetical protein